MSSVLNISYAETCDQKNIYEGAHFLTVIPKNEFLQKHFSKIFNTDSDAKYKEQLFLRTTIFRTPFTSEHFLKTRGFIVKVN